MARGYFACSSGNITDEVIMKYIENQDVTVQDDEFKIAGELKTAISRSFKSTGL